MKKFALLFVALLALSCSDDDSSSGTSGADLKTMVTSIYGMNGSLLDRAVMDFEDNKPVKYTVYHQSGEIFRYHNYTYGQDGQLTTMKIYSAGQLAVTQEYQYDGQRRIIRYKSTDHLEFDGIVGADYQYDYTYNSNNTITQVSDGGNESTYYLNAAGQVYKIVHAAGYVSEVTYSGNDVLTWFQGSTTSVTFHYDDVHPVKGHFRKYMKNQFNGYEANHVLVGGHGNAIISTDRYITHQEQSNGGTTHYSYEFNPAGYPVRIASSSNGEEPNVFVDITYK